MSNQFSTIENRAVKWRHVKLALRNMHLASEKSITRSITDFAERNFIDPATGQNALPLNTSCGNNDACSIAGKIIICRGSGKAWGSISMITCVISDGTANDGG